MGQVYESVSSTISGWAGALVGAGIELYSFAIAASISIQAERTQAQGQYLGEMTRAGAVFEGGNISGTEWAGGAARTLLSDAQSGKQTLAGRAAGSVIEIGGGVIGLGMQYSSIQNRAAGQQSALNEACNTRTINQERASQYLILNQENYRGEIIGANKRRAQGLTVAEIAGANQAIAGTNRGAAVAKGAINQGYHYPRLGDRLRPGR